MKYLPFENYKLTSKLSAEEIKDRLKDKIDPKEDFFTQAYHWSKKMKPYAGYIQNNYFEIYRIMGYRSSFKPIISGTIAPSLSESIIHVKMKMLGFTYVFISIWFGGLTYAMIMVAQQQISNRKFEPMTLLIVPFFLLGYALVMWGFKSESIRTKKFLKELLEGNELIHRRGKATHNSR
jgi:hypothetical protein